jgi:hypothetical protein
MTNAVNIAQSGSNNVTMRNRIINGAMVIDQRNNGASKTITDVGAITYVLDRWAGYGSQASKFSIQQNAGAVTPPAGFTNYLGATSLSAYSVGSGEQFVVRQNIEGYNLADLGWGYANAQPATVSFWVRSSLTGTFTGNVCTATGDRSLIFSYTISAANTWEYKTVTIAGDTTGGSSWLTTNGIGVTLNFSLGAGSSLQGTVNTWNSSYLLSVSGAQSVVGTSGATFYITGVQFEEGTAASPFENRLYGTELALCQRYYYKHADINSRPIGVGCYISGTRVDAFLSFKQTMRTAPTLVQLVGTNLYNFYSGSSDLLNGFSIDVVGTDSVNLTNNTEASGASGRGGWAVIESAGGFISFNAEL